MSSRLPMGVPTRYKVPAGAASVLPATVGLWIFLAIQGKFSTVAGGDIPGAILFVPQLMQDCAVGLEGLRSCPLELRTKPYRKSTELLPRQRLVAHWWKRPRLAGESPL